MQIIHDPIKGKQWEEIKEENRAILGIKESYFKEERKVPLNEHLEHEATPEKIEAVKDMWKNGISIYDMAKYFNNDNPDNIFLIIMDLSQKGRIKQRSGGVFGWTGNN